MDRLTWNVSLIRAGWDNDGIICLDERNSTDLMMESNEQMALSTQGDVRNNLQTE